MEEDLTHTNITSILSSAGNFLEIKDATMTTPPPQGCALGVFSSSVQCPMSGGEEGK